MIWILFKSKLKKILIWLKEYWQIPFLVVWTLVVYVLSRRNTDAMLEVIQTRNESYKQQIEALRTAHNDEILKRNRLSEEYDKTIEALEADFANEKKKLTDLQKNDIKEVVIKSKGDPNEIKKRIEEDFGFFYVE